MEKSYRHDRKQNIEIIGLLYPEKQLLDQTSIKFIYFL